MASKPMQAASVEPHWLWSWGGVCVGYLRGDSLFACDGLEVGRFSGSEVYGPDGSYLGELIALQEGPRLAASVYKKTRTMPRFAPTIESRYRRPADRPGEGPSYCGYEEFRAPWIEKSTRR